MRIYWAPNQHIRIISEISYDTEDWSICDFIQFVILEHQWFLMSTFNRSVVIYFGLAESYLRETLKEFCGNEWKATEVRVSSTNHTKTQGHHNISHSLTSTQLYGLHSGSETALGTWAQKAKSQTHTHSLPGESYFLSFRLSAKLSLSWPSRSTKVIYNYLRDKEK